MVRGQGEAGETRPCSGECGPGWSEPGWKRRTHSDSRGFGVGTGSRVLREPWAVFQQGKDTEAEKLHTHLQGGTQQGHCWTSPKSHALVLKEA